MQAMKGKFPVNRQTFSEKESAWNAKRMWEGTQMDSRGRLC